VYLILFTALLQQQELYTLNTLIKFSKKAYATANRGTQQHADSQ